MVQASLFTDELPILGAWAFRPAPNPNPYLLPAPVRWPLVRVTRQRVVVRVGSRATAYDPALLITVPDDAAWARLLAAHGAYQTTLTALAVALREIGTYRARLQTAVAAAGSFAAVPNPLLPGVLRIPDPDEYYSSSLNADGRVPDLKRYGVIRHTAKMITLRESEVPRVGLSHLFGCPDDATYTRVAALHAAAQQAQTVWAALLAGLGPMRLPAIT